MSLLSSNVYSRLFYDLSRRPSQPEFAASRMEAAGAIIGQGYNTSGRIVLAVATIGTLWQYRLATLFAKGIICVVAHATLTQVSFRVGDVDALTRVAKCKQAATMTAMWKI